MRTMISQKARRKGRTWLPTPILIADYGSSQGRNWLAPLGAAIEMLRERIGAHRSDLTHVGLKSLRENLVLEGRHIA